MIEQLGNLFRRALQDLIIFVVRPYVIRELPGWGRMYDAFVGGYKRDWLWANATPMVIRGKLHGYVMHLDLSYWADRAAYFLGRWYDLDTQLLMADFLEFGDTVVDVGANRGMFALAASRLVGKEGRVICFEPNPHCGRSLDREISENGIENVRVDASGLGESEDELVLTVPLVNPGEGTFGMSAYADGKTYQVRAKIKRGDLALAGERPSLIKIDVEGFECRVIAGLSEIIGRHHPVVLTEIIPQHLARCGSSVAQLMSLMETLGYRGFMVRLWRERGGYCWQLVPLEVQESAAAVCDAVWLHPASRRRHTEAKVRHARR